ncbi:hypothetical protein MMC29_007773 [Sticta canariensis]|nr:hypothetical protein [Sticta canariensis]
MVPLGSLLPQKRCRAMGNHYRDRASVSVLPPAKRSWVDGAVGIRGNEEREWLGGVVFLLLLAGAFLVLCAMVRLAAVWLKRQLGDYREWCEANERPRRAHDGGDAHRWMPIANDEFFTVPEDMRIGYASAPRNGVVEDEDLERGRPPRRFWHFDTQNTRPGRASSPSRVATTGGWRHGFQAGTLAMWGTPMPRIQCELERSVAGDPSPAWEHRRPPRHGGRDCERFDKD